jgi:uncharacterized membrane protein
METSKCHVCSLGFPSDEVVGPEALRLSMQNLIIQDFPTWGADSRICGNCLEAYRGRQIQQMLEEEKGELSALDEEVLKSLNDQQLVTANSEASFEKNLTLGQILSDRMAFFGGSWSFLIIFAIFMIAWIAYNSISPKFTEFDPYPFILLNLILSCLAAVQAPIIMMSQNRQEAKDRKRSENDYMVNLKAELEIRQLHLKMDQLLKHQWRRLLEIQQLQLEIMNENRNMSKGKTAHSQGSGGTVE